MSKLIYIDLQRIQYDLATQAQQHLVDRLIAQENQCAYLLLCEHDPVVTLGRSADPKHVLLSPRELKDRGIALVKTSRGGDVTYHGPGQLVGYPIVRLDRKGRNVHGFMRDLEEVIIRVLAEFGVKGSRRSGFTGVWVGQEKIAAIGIAVRRWISYHGFSLNIATDLPGFDVIVPCGISDRGVTSLSRLLGREISLRQVKPLVVEQFARVMGFEQTQLNGESVDQLIG